MQVAQGQQKWEGGEREKERVEGFLASLFYFLFLQTKKEKENSSWIPVAHEQQLILTTTIIIISECFSGNTAAVQAPPAPPLSSHSMRSTSVLFLWGGGRTTRFLGQCQGCILCCGRDKGCECFWSVLLSTEALELLLGRKALGSSFRLSKFLSPLWFFGEWWW